jgi:type II secretory pathway pseudopilin PulG
VIACHTRVRPDPNDTGETLVELVIAVAIMGIAVVAIVSGIATTILMSDIHRKQATAGAYVRSYAEAVESHVDAGNFNPSTTPAALQSAVVFDVPDNFTATVTAPVRCWNETSGLGVFGGCAPGSTVQQVTLNVASDDSRASESLVVVVRKPQP